METEIAWWHWGLVGFGFILAELALPAFVLVWFGLAAFLVMIVLLVAPIDLTTQLWVWLLTSMLMVALWFSVFKRHQHKSLIGRSSANIVGEIGMLAEPVEPFKNGRVRFQKPLLGSDNWECIANEAIEAGARVRVVRVEGSMLTIEKERSQK